MAEFQRQYNIVAKFIDSSNRLLSLNLSVDSNWWYMTLDGLLLSFLHLGFPVCYADDNNAYPN